MIDTTPIGSFSTTASMSAPKRVVAVAVQRARQRGGIAPKVRRPANLAARLGDRLAAFQRLQQGHALDIRLDQVGDLQQHRGPGLARQPAPAAVVKGRAGGGDRGLGLGLADPSAARLTTTPCEGETRSDTAPSALSCQTPPIRWRAWKGLAGKRGTGRGDQGQVGHLRSPEILVCAWRGRRRRLRPGRRCRGDGSRAQRLDHRGAILARAGMDHAFGDLDRAGRQRCQPCRQSHAPRRAGPPRPRPQSRRQARARPRSGARTAPFPSPSASGSSRASRCVPDQPGTMPTPASGRARVAPGAITRMSQAAASSSPPPKAWPFSTAIVGLRQPRQPVEDADARRAPSAGRSRRATGRPRR